MTKYSYGDASNPQPTDRRFDTEDEAAQAALDHHEKIEDETILAVWAEYDDGNAETLYLVFEGELWKPA